jgi:hypothetical protein
MCGVPLGGAAPGRPVRCPFLQGRPPWTRRGARPTGRQPFAPKRRAPPCAGPRRQGADRQDRRRCRVPHRHSNARYWWAAGVIDGPLRGRLVFGSCGTSLEAGLRGPAPPPARRLCAASLHSAHSVGLARRSPSAPRAPAPFPASGIAPRTPTPPLPAPHRAYPNPRPPDPARPARRAPGHRPGKGGGPGDRPEGRHKGGRPHANLGPGNLRSRWVGRAGEGARALPKSRSRFASPTTAQKLPRTALKSAPQPALETSPQPAPQPAQKPP